MTGPRPLVPRHASTPRPAALSGARTAASSRGGRRRPAPVHSARPGPAHPRATREAMGNGAARWPDKDRSGRPASRLPGPATRPLAPRGPGGGSGGGGGSAAAAPARRATRRDPAQPRPPGPRGSSAGVWPRRAAAPARRQRPRPSTASLRMATGRAQSRGGRRAAIPTPPFVGAFAEAASRRTARARPPFPRAARRTPGGRAERRRRRPVPVAARHARACAGALRLSPVRPAPPAPFVTSRAIRFDAIGRERDAATGARARVSPAAGRARGTIRLAHPGRRPRLLRGDDAGARPMTRILAPYPGRRRSAPRGPAVAAPAHASPRRRRLRRRAGPAIARRALFAATPLPLPPPRPAAP